MPQLELPERAVDTKTEEEKEIDKQNEIDKVTRETIEPVFDEDLEVLKTNPEEENSGDENDNIKKIE